MAPYGEDLGQRGLVCIDVLVPLAFSPALTRLISRSITLVHLASSPRLAAAFPAFHRLQQGLRFLKIQRPKPSVNSRKSL